MTQNKEDKNDSEALKSLKIWLHSHTWCSSEQARLQGIERRKISQSEFFERLRAVYVEKYPDAVAGDVSVPPQEDELDVRDSEREDVANFLRLLRYKGSSKEMIGVRTILMTMLRDSDL